jgi:hypothetical protein
MMEEGVLGHEGATEKLSKLVSEQLHKWYGHYILTKNRKTLSLWAISLIKCSISPLLTNVKLNSHLIDPNTCAHSILIRRFHPQLITAEIVCYEIIKNTSFFNLF